MVPGFFFALNSQLHSLRHVDVWLARPVGVRHHPDYGEAELLMELIGVAAQVLYFRKVLQDVGVEVHTRQGCHAAFVVGAEPEGVTAALPDAFFQVGDEGAADASTAKIRAHDQRVQLPRVTIVGADTADPSEDRAALVDGCPADPSLPERFPYLFEGGVHVRPGMGPMLLEPLDQEGCRLPDGLFVTGLEIDDPHDAVAPSLRPL